MNMENTGRGSMRGKVQGLRSTNWQAQNRQTHVKNSIGSGVAKELICMTHGHELRGETAGGKGNSTRQRGAKEKKNKRAIAA